MTEEEKAALRDTSIFIVMIYIETWFTAPLAANAPSHDLQFFKKLYNYQSIDKSVSTATVEKFKNHLWYLNAESVAMSFFDTTLSLEVKRNMVLELNSIEEIENYIPKRIEIKLKDIAFYCDKEIDHFVTSQTRKFFKRFQINEDFLAIDPAFWPQNESYENGLEVLKQLKVVNDVAERGVKLFTEYNEILTKNEDRKQFVVQIVSEYRKNFPDAKKETVTKQFK